jgi:fructose-6-phosphate aldolase 2
MVRDARAIVKLLGEGTVVKVPSIPEGFKAIRMLKEEGIASCGTVVYTPLQAYLAAKAGADYVAPYVNRIDNMGFDGVGVVEQIQDILTLHEMDTQVLAASFKNSQQVLTLCAYGIGSATCAPAVIDAFVKNPAIDGAVGDFIRDFAGLAGEGKTMADLIG